MQLEPSKDRFQRAVEPIQLRLHPLQAGAVLTAASSPLLLFTAAVDAHRVALDVLAEQLALLGVVDEVRVLAREVVEDLFAFQVFLISIVVDECVFTGVVGAVSTTVVGVVGFCLLMIMMLEVIKNESREK